MRYDPARVRASLDELLLVAPALRSCDAYRFDLVNVARQALDNRARALLPQIASAYHARNRTLFRSLVREWEADLALVDRLSGTDARSMVGPWIAAARSWGADAAERDRLEYDARSVLANWSGRVPSDVHGLHDYANREWAGLVMRPLRPAVELLLLVAGRGSDERRAAGVDRLVRHGRRMVAADRAASDLPLGGPGGPGAGGREGPAGLNGAVSATRSTRFRQRPGPTGDMPPSADRGAGTLPGTGPAGQYSWRISRTRRRGGPCSGPRHRSR